MRKNTGQRVGRGGTNGKMGWRERMGATFSVLLLNAYCKIYQQNTSKDVLILKLKEGGGIFYLMRIQ